MTAKPLTEADLDALRALDTPTVCNALEIVAPERRAIGFTTAPLVCPRPELPPIVGYARTARQRSIRPAQAGAAERLASARLALWKLWARNSGIQVQAAYSSH